MLVQLCNLFLLETELQSDRLLNLCRQVSCQRRGVSASSSTVFPRTCSLEKQEEEAEINNFCNLWSTLDPSYLFWQRSLHTQFLLLEIQTWIDLWYAVCLPILMKGHSANIWARHQRRRITKLRSTPHCFSALSLLGRRVFSGPLLSSFSEPKVAYTGWPLIAHVTAVSFPPHHTTWIRILYKKFSSQTAQCKSEAASDSNKN